jgi:hypothetical protein
MTDKTPEEADGWRGHAAARLNKAGFLTSSPMRQKGMLTKGERMGSDYTKYGNVAELRSQSILTRDRFDVRHADFVLANMSELGVAWNSAGEKVGIPSIGSDGEIFWSLEWDIPVILIAPPGNPYELHPFLRAAQGIIRFDTLDEGIDWLIQNESIYIEEV